MIWDHDDDKPREECGVFGVFGHPEACLLTALGLHALQHRGQEACGIATWDGKLFHNERHLGLVLDPLRALRLQILLPESRQLRLPPASSKHRRTRLFEL